jgi:hypothetical protein
MTRPTLAAVVVLITGIALVAREATPPPTAGGLQAKDVLAKLAVPRGVCVVLGPLNYGARSFPLPWSKAARRWIMRGESSSP